jgi:hypothetical protein
VLLQVKGFLGRTDKRGAIRVTSDFVSSEMRAAMVAAVGDQGVDRATTRTELKPWRYLSRRY